MSQQSFNKIFTSTDWIKQLNEIDSEVTTLLQSAGRALECLTNPTNSNSELFPAVDSHKETFADAAKNYYSTLASIDVRLTRQVYALEEAGIVIPEKDPRESAGGSTAREALTQEGMDVSWLNSRKDTVGREMEGEIWAKAREFVQKLEEERESADSAGSGDAENGMEVD